MIDYQRVESGGWIADFLPDHGGHLVRLRHVASGRDLLNFPASEAEYHEQPERFGIPVLFPPNRIVGGNFSWEWRDYQLPVNDKAFGSHLHGFVRHDVWDMTVKSHESGLGSSVCLSYIHGSDRNSFVAYPHHFRLEISYDLLSSGVVQSIYLVNEDAKPGPAMPWGLGFHTAFLLPDDPLRTHVRVTANNECYELDSRLRVPTGRRIAWPEGHQYQHHAGAWYRAQPTVSCHSMVETRVLEGHTFRGALLHFENDNVTLAYEISDGFKYWFLWTPPDNDRVLCIEPMTCRANAAREAAEGQAHGWQGLKPGECWSARTRLCLW